MTLITYQQRAVAMAGPDRVYLAPHIDQRPDDDPLRRFVCFLVLYTRDVQLRHLPGEPHRYLPRRAERYARAALIPQGEFAALAHRSDQELAERFRVPVEQIARRRDDLAVLASRAGHSRKRRGRLERGARRSGCQRA
jgi:IrrE N-terminal-like domain